MRANLIKSSNTTKRVSPKRMSTRPAGFFNNKGNKGEGEREVGDEEHNAYEEELSAFWSKVNAEVSRWRCVG